MKWYTLLIGTMVMANPFRPAFGQSAPPIMRIEKLMTPEEMRATGVDKLAPAKRQALDRWLTKFTLRVAKAEQKLDASPKPDSDPSADGRASYTGSASGHWISSNDSDEAVITLEDGSMWQINSVDQVDTALWLPITDITIVHAKSPIGDYKYQLIDTEDDEKALAKYLGTQ